MKVLVCGGRDYDDQAFVSQTLSSFVITTIMQGGAEGADTLAQNYALAHFIPLWTFRANWKEHGKAAGPIRNQSMLDYGKPDLVIAFPGGRGTADMVRRAKKAGVLVHIASPAPPWPTTP